MVFSAYSHGVVCWLDPLWLRPDTTSKKDGAPG